MDFTEMNKAVIKEFRENGGVCGGRVEGEPVVLVNMIGAKSGREYCIPLVYSRDGDDVVVIASAAGAPKNPDWFHNLKANPQVTIEVLTDSWEATARQVFGDERRRLYDAQAAVMPYFADYENVAAEHGREIPVFRLVRS